MTDEEKKELRERYARMENEQWFKDAHDDEPLHQPMMELVGDAPMCPKCGNICVRTVLCV